MARDHCRLHNPFPREPKGLTFVQGRLHFDPSAVPSTTLAAGKHFLVAWDAARGSLSVRHLSQPDRALWATPPGGAAFISAALAESTIQDSRGSYSLHDRVDMVCTHQTIESISIAIANPASKNATAAASIAAHNCSPGGDARSVCLGNGIASPNPASAAADADGTAVDAAADQVVVTGCLYTDAELAMAEICRRNHVAAAADGGAYPPARRRPPPSWFGFGGGGGARVGVRYRVVFCERREHQLGFEVELDAPTREGQAPSSAGTPLSEEEPEVPDLWLWSREPRSAFRRRGRGRRSSGLAPLDYGHGYRLGWGWSDVAPLLMYPALKRVHKNFGNTEEDDYDDAVGVPRLNRILLTYASHAGERFFGFGEQFSCFDMKGKRVPIMVQEQGLGRGDQPITAAANLVAHRAGGDWHTTYAPSPHYMTSDMNSLYLEGYEHSVFDLTRRDRVQVQVHAGGMRGRILHGRTPAELIAQYTAAIGRMRALPAWITKGAIVGMQGGHDAVRAVWRQLEDHDVPLAAFWLQDWVGQRRTSIGWQLWWNWEVDREHYPGWENLVGDLDARGVRTMTYCNPFVAPTEEKANRRSDHFGDAKEEGHIVADTSGAPYMVPNTSFEAAMVDLTNPAARTWLKGIMHEMVKTGVRGWMADFGESLPFDSCLYSGEDPATAHNRYPEMWAELNREFVEEWEQQQRETKRGRNRTEDKDEDEDDKLVFFMRAGYRGSPRWATLFWAGDQMVSWQRHDGIKSAITGLLSSGVSGYAFNHSDIGGYCTVDLPLLRYRRSEELLLRWMELNAFSVIFRTHEGNVPGANAQFYSSERTLAHFARCAKMYRAWEFYRRQLVKEAAATGMPVVRHLFLHYPHDTRVQALVYEQFLVGSEILVVPVLDKGRARVRAYFPGGDAWEHVWTGLVYRAPAKGGLKAWVPAPLGFPAVFVKRGAWVGAQFRHNLVKEGVLQLR